MPDDLKTLQQRIASLEAIFREMAADLDRRNILVSYPVLAHWFAAHRTAAERNPLAP